MMKKKNNDNEKGNIHDQIKATDGRYYSTQEVFVAALIYLKKRSFDFFNKKYAN